MPLYGPGLQTKVTIVPGLEGDLLYDSYFTIHYSMAGWMAVSF